ncbi:MAG TPA: Uma2 family endonuclease [Pyrinomonadaceae bacterium]|jgi:Uma2 family endonuclease
MAANLHVQATGQNAQFTALEPIERDRNGEIIYPEQRLTDMGETFLHYELQSDLIKMLQAFLQHRENVFVAANLNLYYEKGNPRVYFTPDLMICFGIENRPRQIHKLWEEGTFPQVVFEITSDRTWKNDISDKYEAYAEQGVEEYYLLDSERIYLPLPLMAYQFTNGRLKYIPTQNDRIFSPRLGLEIVNTGKEFRLFNPANDEFLKTPQELEAENEQLKARLAELERLLKK